MLQQAPTRPPVTPTSRPPPPTPSPSTSKFLRPAQGVLQSRDPGANLDKNKPLTAWAQPPRRASRLQFPFPRARTRARAVIRMLALRLSSPHLARPLCALLLHTLLPPTLPSLSSSLPSLDLLPFCALPSFPRPSIQNLSLPLLFFLSLRPGPHARRALRTWIVRNNLRDIKGVACSRKCLWRQRHAFVSTRELTSQFAYGAPNCHTSYTSARTCSLAHSHH